jgi:hypothetical protein
MNCDGDIVMNALLHPAETPDRPLLFMKHMAHHLIELDLGFISETHNIFLIRDPRDMLPSLVVQLPNARLGDTGLAVQSELYESLLAAGRKPAVLDARQLLLDPPGVLAALCRNLEIDFDPNMLSWPAGPMAEDGVWAKHWYHAVHKSTGFSKYVAKHGFPENLKVLLDECTPHYEKLYKYAIRGPKGE